MYAWLWSRIPGPLMVRILIAVAAVVVVVLVLFTFVFPWLQPLVPFNDVTVGGD